MRALFLTSLAMLAFAANSLLARLALAQDAIDPVAYTGVRLATGAAVLVLLMALRSGKTDRAWRGMGNRWQAAALFGYALAFSLAYVILGAAMGALILFASVQVGMVSRAVVSGDRPEALEWMGLAIASVAFGYLLWPGLTAPDPVGVILMMLSGLCWAAYSLLGRGSLRPLADTAGNFLRCLPFALVLILVGALIHLPSAQGLAFAALSGAVASGLGYAVWYTALPYLSRTRASIVQLTVPVIAAFGAIPLLGEDITPRLVISSAAILGGIALATLLAARRRGA